MAPAVKKPSKPIFRTDIPFTETKWPQTSPHDQTVILDLLCNLLEPLGHHRKTHIQPSKGKKRKRKPTTLLSSSLPQITDTPDTTPPPPPAPEIGSYILVGLNSITRHLSSLAANSAPSTLPASQTTSRPTPQAQPVSVLIIPTTTPSTSLPYAHLPTLLHLSSRSSPSSPTPPPPPLPPPRLVTLPPSSELKMASALHIPRVGAIAILEGCPSSESLVEYVRVKVGVVECEWIDEGLKAEWKGTKIGGQTKTH